MAHDYGILKTYTGDQLRRVAMPIGGIGTGTVALGGRGDLRDWEIANRPAKRFRPGNAFFSVWTQDSRGNSAARILEGPIDTVDLDGEGGCPVPHHGLPRFRNCSFESVYPFGRVQLSDDDVPVAVALEAFNPLVPTEADDSGLPVAQLKYTLKNTSGIDLDVAVCGTIQNFIGDDGTLKDAKDNVIAFKHERSLRGLMYSSNGVDPKSPAWGTVALTTATLGDVTYREHWPELSWGGSILDFWDDFSADGRLDPRPDAGIPRPTGSLAVRVPLAAGESTEITFLLTWHFPNRLAWPNNDAIVGNYYTTLYGDAWDAAMKIYPQLPELEAETEKFVHAFLAADLPAVVKEAALYNVSTLRTQTCFRTADGKFYAWEGCRDNDGCCHGSCTHVWNYEQATAFLFGGLAEDMRATEFELCTVDNGLMSFRVNLPVANATDYGIAAADGQMGCLMKLYRDWQLSGDDDMLRRTWPHAKKALEFCWITDGWDADQDGMMEGAQHNTMDVEYYGPNPQMGFWYLGALRSCEEMASYVGEGEFADKCRSLFEHGSAWMDENLFNGEYYEHQVWPAKSKDAVAKGLIAGMGGDPTEPIMQLGKGCLVDQMIGQLFAHVCGLGYLAKPAHIETTLHTLMNHNFQETLWSNFNPMRTYALQDESALLMASYPHGERPVRPFPYFHEVMTGFEYTAGIHMLYEGLLDDGMRVIDAIRSRYDGKRRNPFDEVECGHHYGRAMISWAAVLALSGFHYSGVTKTITFADSDEPMQGFWSNGWAWGVYRQRPVDPFGASKDIHVEITVEHGELSLRHIRLSGVGTASLDAERLVIAGETVGVTVAA